MGLHRIIASAGAVSVGVFGFAQCAGAGSTVIGQLTPPPNENVTSVIAGIAADTGLDPLILEGVGHIQRVSRTTMLFALLFSTMLRTLTL